MSKSIHRLLKITPQLSKVVGGVAEISRPQALKKVWEYIKVNDLKSAELKVVQCDSTLLDVFGQPTVTSKEVMRLMSPHFEKAKKEEAK